MAFKIKKDNKSQLHKEKSIKNNEKCTTLKKYVGGYCHSNTLFVSRGTFRERTQNYDALAAEPGQSVTAPKPSEKSSDDDSNKNLELDDSNSDVDINKDEEEVEYFCPSLKNITNGKFLLVSFLSDSRK
ncbi:unnamed protein product [Diabrotica balteata]|uniref:Uncharacterized protein n=1 Tax=Diabrotica balteata TaxID=107213 RepID=A0A9N9T638_DIABA|nr:unnamed protein product [Diabrotica balteata]